MQSPLYAELVLLLEIAIGLGLLAGVWLARKQKFRAHASCQSVAVLLNLVIVAVVMVPSFREQVSPKIPQKLGKSYVALATTHAALGAIVELAALYNLRPGGWYCCSARPPTCVGTYRFPFDIEKEKHGRA